MVAKSDTGSHPELQSNLGAGFSLSSSSTTSFSYRLLQSHAGTARFEMFYRRHGKKQPPTMLTSFCATITTLSWL